MAPQPTFEAVKEGDQIPTVTLNCDSQRLVLWAAGSGDYYQIHYDKDFAQGTGLPDRITHGALKHALLGRMLHEWVGEKGRVQRVACQYPSMDMIRMYTFAHGGITAKPPETARNPADLETAT